MTASNDADGSKTTYLWLVNNDLPAEIADAYNKWYTDVHIPQLLTLPGFVSGQRFEQSSVQNGSKEPELRRYLSVFELEGDAQEAFDALRSAMAEGRIEPAPFPGSVSTSANFIPLGPKLSS